MSTADQHNAQPPPVLSRDLELSDDPALADALLDHSGTLPIAYSAQIALMRLAAQRLRAHHRAALLYGEAGWPGWTRIAEGWLVKVTEDDDGVWLMLRGPQHSPGFDGLAFRKPADSTQAQTLRKLRKALKELA